MAAGPVPLSILGIPVDPLGMREAVDRIFTMIDEYTEDGRPRQVSTVNVDFLVNTLSWKPGSVRHPELIDILRRCDLVTPDGMPIVWISRLLGKPLKERVTGADLVPAVARRAAQLGKSVYFLGGRGSIAYRTAEILKSRNPDLIIAGIDSPTVHTEGVTLADMDAEDAPIVKKINDARPDILFIAFGNPKQEVWFARNRTRLKVPVSIGIGGTFEFISGRVKRAPLWVQKAGMEWIFRIIQEPKRLWKRYFTGMFKFAFIALPAVISALQARLRSRRPNRKTPVGAGPYSDIAEKGFLDVIRLSDRLDTVSAPSVRETAARSLENHETVIFDCSGVSFIDSSGLGLLVGIWKEANRTGKEILFIGISESLIRFMKSNRVWDLFGQHHFISRKALVRDLEERKRLPAFFYTTRLDENVLIADIYGRLDASSIPSFDAFGFFDSLRNNHCVMDMEDLRFIDSSGIGFLIKIQRMVSQSEHRLVLCGLNETVSQILRITRLDSFFITTPDIPGAMKKISELS